MGRGRAESCTAHAPLMTLLRFTSTQAQTGQMGHAGRKGNGSLYLLGTIAVALGWGEKGGKQ